jgi:diguanylate cyclase
MSSGNAENSYERTVDIVRSAIPRMSELKIPITPTNYAVWYEYLTAANDALRDELDQLLVREEPITNAELRDLYERYLEHRDEKLQVAKTTLGQVLTALIDHMDQADGHYGRFSSELSEIAEQLGAQTSAADLDAIIERAVQATRSALARGTALRQRFSGLAEEMQKVRSALVRSHEEARTDPLTGVNNRLAFQEALDVLGQGAADEGHPPCLIMVDADHFKAVNDNYGHLAGDHVLRTVAQEIKANVRGRDMVARYGGEEFAVLLRDTPRSGCMAVAENLRAGIEHRLITLPRELGAGRSLSVTVSLGGAWLRDGEPIEAFVDRADRALYRSKQAGRNRVSWEGRETEK